MKHWSTRCFAICLAVFALTNPSIASDAWPSFDRFTTCFNRNQPDSLRALAQELRAASDPYDRHLGILALAGAQFRSDDLATCTRTLDSLERVVARDALAVRAVAQRIRSMLMSAVGDPERGVLEADRGLALLKGGKLPEEEVALMVVRAEALTQLDDLDAALQQFAEAQRLTSAANYLRGECLVRIGLGNIRYKQGRYDEAWQDYLRTFTVASANGFDKVAQSALGNLGGVATMTGKYDLAVHLYDSLLTLLGPRSPELRARLHGQKGYVLIEMEDYSAAVQSCKRSIALSDSIGDLRGSTDVAHDLAYAMWQLGERDGAMRLMHQMLATAVQRNWAEQQQYIHLDLHDWYKELGRSEQALLHMSRYSALSDSLSRVRFSQQIAHSEIAFETERKEHRIAEQDQALRIAEAEDRRKSMQRNLSIALVAVLLVVAVVLWRSLRIRRKLAAHERELHAQRVDELMHQQEIKAINAMLEGQEKERDRVAKDLHDRLGSMLSAIKHQVGALEHEVQLVRADQGTQYTKVNRMLDEAVGEVRRISHDMIAVTLSRFGLSKALEDLCDTVRLNGRLAVELRVFGLEQRMDRALEIVVYRMVQELVSNVLKHAQATELSVNVTREPGRLSVMVIDDGKGFDPQGQVSGIGLGNVRARASAIGAVVRVDSTPGKGTTVSVECPIVE